MPAGTLANMATSAFVRTPPVLAEQIVWSLLTFPVGKATTILDPTAGEGDLLIPYLSVPQARLYGVEISAARADVARRRLPGADIVTCAFEGVSIPKGSMSLVLCNPPYFFQNGERAEYRIIADAGLLLMPGGIMVAIIPARSAWDGTMVNHWCRWYQRVGIWKFPDRVDEHDEGAFEDFTQIVVVGIRRAEPCDPDPAEQRRLAGYRYRATLPKGNPRARLGWERGDPPPVLPATPLASPYYVVPEATSRPQIVVRHADEAMLLAALEKSGAHLSPWWEEATTWERKQQRGQPVMPFTGLAHVAAEVLTGLLDGDIITSPDGKPHVLTAFVGHEWVPVKIDEEEQEKLRERGVRRVEARQWQDKPMLSILDLASGAVHFEQGEGVFAFLTPWLARLAARVTEKRVPRYRLDPAEWELRVLAHFGQDKQLPHAAFPGLSPAQMHRVFAMGRALDACGRVAIQGEPGTGKTRMTTAVAARMAFLWRSRHTPLVLGRQRQPAWIRGLRRAWLKNPRALAMLGLSPVSEAETGRVAAYRRHDGTLLACEDAGPRALPVAVVTPKKVTKEYAKEIRAAWPEAEVVLIESHRDIEPWLTRCATSSAPAVVAVFPHSLTRAFGRAWQPAIVPQMVPVQVPVTDPPEHLLPHLDPVEERGKLTGYRWKATGDLFTRAVLHERFACPDCGAVLHAVPGRLHEVERPSSNDQRQECLLFGPKQETDQAEKDDDRREPVTSRTWFTIKPRWCACQHARNAARRQAGRPLLRAPLWTDARRPDAQSKCPQMDFAPWHAAMTMQQKAEVSGGTGDAQGQMAFLSAGPASVGRSRKGTTSSTAPEPAPVSLVHRQLPAVPAQPGKQQVTPPRLTDVLAQRRERRERLRDAWRQRAQARLEQVPPLPDSFSPYEYLFRFFRGCVALVIVDESHNGRGRDTDIAHAFHQAMLAAQTRLLASGTHFGGDLLGFYHYWFRFHPAFWQRLGLGWHDAEKALQRYGVVQEWTKEYESDARRGSGQTTVQVSTIPAPGLSAQVIPFLLEDLVYLTVLDVGMHMPARVEIPEIVSLTDPQVKTWQAQAREARRLLDETRARLDAYEAQAAEREELDEEGEREMACLAREVEEAMQRWQEAKRLADLHDLAGQYTDLVRTLEDLSRQRNQAARLAKGTVPRWFAALPCDQPFEVWQTRRDGWGNALDRDLVVQTPRLAWDHRYPLERRLIEIVQQERAEGRRVMVYFEQNELRSMARRLVWVLQDFHPWVLPNDTRPENRQQAILDAVLKQGHEVVIVPYRRVNEGLNLQSAIDSIIWHEMALNLFLLDQASRRAWRLGKREEVRIYYLVYTNTAGHHKLRKLGNQSGAAAAFAGEVARGALVEEAGADQTTLARLSSLLEGEAADTADTANEQEDASDDLLPGEGDIAQEDASLKAAFARRAEELRAVLKAGRSFLGGIRDTLEERWRALMATPVCSVWKEWPAPRPVRLPCLQQVAEQPARARIVDALPLSVDHAVARETEQGTQPVPVPLPVAGEQPFLASAETATPVPVESVQPPSLASSDVGRRAQVEFGNLDDIAATRRARRRGRSYDRVKRKTPLVEHDIPAVDATPASDPDPRQNGHRASVPVPQPSLWDLLDPAAEQAGERVSVLPASRQASVVPRQAGLWD